MESQRVTQPGVQAAAATARGAPAGAASATSATRLDPRATPHTAIHHAAARHTAIHHNGAPGSGTPHTGTPHTGTRHNGNGRPPAVASPPAVVLCGGAGQRMGELTAAVPKPMLTVGGTPLLMHIMRTLATGGSDEFVLAVGHLGHVVKDFFLQFQAHAADFTIRLGRHPSLSVHGSFPEEGWQVTCADTGEHAGTGSRLRATARMVSRWPVIVAYGDVLANVDIGALLAFHRAHGRLATVTAAAPPARFGHLDIADDQRVSRFDEKRFHGEPAAQPGLVSIGFFVLERAAIERYVPASQDVMFEEEPIRKLAADGELMAYRHDGYWQPIDTPKELAAASAEWDSGNAPWRAGRP